MPADVIVEAEQAPFPEHHDAERGELLGRARHVELGLRRDRRGGLQVGAAVAREMHHCAVPDDRDGEAGSGLDPARDDPVDMC